MMSGKVSSSRNRRADASFLLGLLDWKQDYVHYENVQIQVPTAPSDIKLFLMGA